MFFFGTRDLLFLVSVSVPYKILNMNIVRKADWSKLSAYVRELSCTLRWYNFVRRQVIHEKAIPHLPIFKCAEGKGRSSLFFIWSFMGPTDTVREVSEREVKMFILSPMRSVSVNSVYYGTSLKLSILAQRPKCAFELRSPLYWKLWKYQCTQAFLSDRALEPLTVLIRTINMCNVLRNIRTTKHSF